MILDADARPDQVAFAMSRDHLLPPALGRMHPTFRTRTG
ncbi:APC family permease [Pseudonocardia sp. MCCB 268]|nr:APC family permease [Pseudonocardia cytotoxica]